MFTTSRRKIDMHAEKALAGFLDDNFYRMLLKEKKFLSIERVRDKRRQIQGIDIIATSASTKALIDEKAQLYYINKNLPTFAFELDYLSGGERRDGWLINGALETTHYFLLWPFAKEEQLAKVRKRDFTAVNGLIIQKKRLQAYLDSVGFDADFLRYVSQLVREEGIVGRQDVAPSGMYLYVSDARNYCEAPVNLVIRKSLLQDFADMEYRIFQGGFERKK